MASDLYQLSLSDEVRACATPDQTTSANDDEQRAAARSLAIAVVAAEKFNRGSMLRAIEWAAADTAMRVVGRLPDLSLGPAQIRPSTLRRYASESSLKNFGIARLSDHDLRTLLADECKSLALSDALLSVYSREGRDLRRCDNEGDCRRYAVLRYAGRSRGTGAPLDYGSVVTAMADMIQ